LLRQRLLSSLDVATLITSLTIAAAGVLAIASATHGDPAGRAGLWKAQLIWLAVGIVALAVVVGLDYHLLAEFSYALYGATILLLVAVLLFGKEVGGNKSWLDLGTFAFQPSEFAKWTTCVALAAYLSGSVRGPLRMSQALVMAAIAGLPLLLIAIQPDMGTALTFIPIFGAALLMGGLRWRWIVGAFAIVAMLAPFGWNHLKDYQKERILTVFNPERDPAGVGYQARQSKIAIGSGGLVGKGTFQGTQSHLDFLPAQHTDFVLAVFVEEQGFIGAAAILGLFYYLLYRGILAARSSQDRLGTYLCLLVVAWFGGQFAINVGMVLGLLPTIGVPLPLMSYGGTALIAVMCGVGLIVNVRSRRFVN
jgi:rod shape determining protein RodA